MDLQGLYRDLPAIFLVFGHSGITHANAPKEAGNDIRELSLLDLLIEYLDTQLLTLEEVNQAKLRQLLVLLKTWSDDLRIIYHLREEGVPSAQFIEFRDRLFRRIHELQEKNYAVIPNGLISEKDNGKHEHVCLAILKSPSPGKIDWVQIDPGSPYHQRLQTAESLQGDSCLNIQDIDLAMISREWLDLFVDLKVKHPRGYYKINSLYECLLAQLNGETDFKAVADDLFIPFSYESPLQIWDVVREALHYLMSEFFGEEAPRLYNRILVGFKQFLLKEVSDLYEDPDNQQRMMTHDLLHKMCDEVAYSSLKHGTAQQQSIAVNLVEVTRTILHKYLDRQYQESYECERFDVLTANSLSFQKPTLADYTGGASFSGSSLSTRNQFYLLDKPKRYEDPLDYLERILETFFRKLEQSRELHGYILLLRGIESFFLDYLMKTPILEHSSRSFTRDDDKFASSLRQLGERYYSTVRKLVDTRGKGLEYQPQYYANNIIIQFMVYAAVVALNRRHPQIRDLLSQYNLSTESSPAVSLNKIMERLVIDDFRLLDASRILRGFFRETSGKPRLFSYEKFYSYKYEFDISNTANETDEEVKFTYLLLQKDPAALRRFQGQFSRLKEEEYNRQWHEIAYNEGGSWLPRLYFHMQTAAFIAKAALSGLHISDDLRDVCPQWFRMTRSNYNYHETSVSFDLHRFLPVTKSHEVNRLAYLLTKDQETYQRLIFSSGHLLENAVIATQHKKPEDLDAMTYLQLGSLQSQSLLKIERLYIAIKEGVLQFSNKSHAILAKQTLFEFGISGDCSCLERVARHNPELMHRLGLLLVDKALSMKLRLIQHAAIGDLLEILLKLLPLYSIKHQRVLHNGIDAIYQMLKTAIENPSELEGYDQDTSSRTLAYLNAYLVMAVRATSPLTEESAQVVLNALVTLKKYEALNVILDNTLKSQLFAIIMDLSDPLISFIDRDPQLLDHLMKALSPNWVRGRQWQKEAGKSCSYVLEDYTVDPLLGDVYFKGRSMKVVPFDIQSHPVFQSYFGNDNFVVMPDSQFWHGRLLDCYTSVEHDPRIRLTLINKELIIEVFIKEQFHLYCPADKLLTREKHPACLYQDPYSAVRYKHYQLGNTILFMNEQHDVIYRWQLDKNLMIHSPIKNAYLVPFEQLSSPIIKSFLMRLERPSFIEMYSQPISLASPEAVILVNQLYLPRLQLTFQYREGHYFSNEVYGYKLAEKQQIHSLMGFKGYLVLVNDQVGSQQTKIIIPHYRLKLSTNKEDQLVVFDFERVQAPGYFIYDVDEKLGLIKSSTTHANLYLALLHYMIASLDNYDMSSCNSYHLSREYLEFAWQAKPYADLELNTLKQFLSEESMRDFHYHRIALYLKVVSLLSHSVQFDFLYPENSSDGSKKLSAGNILEDNQDHIIRFFAIYLRYKHRVLARIQLTVEEEQDIVRHLFPKEEHAYTDQFKAYVAVNLERSAEVMLSSPKNKDYKAHYSQLFSQEQLLQTSFVNLFHHNIKSFEFTQPDQELNFSEGICGILVDRFRLNHFFQLYTLAKSKFSRLHYRYLLHHVLLRAKHLDIDIPQTVIQMLGRVLLLVSENPKQFPTLPGWIFDYPHEYQLSKDRLVEKEFMEALLEPYAWLYDDTEDKKLWQALCQYDLDSRRVPDWLPHDHINLVLRYEKHTKISREGKRGKVREMFINASRNHQIRIFFENIFELCDQLKLSSRVGCIVKAVNRRSIELLLSPPAIEPEQKKERPHYESLAIVSPPLVNLEQFICIESLPLNESPFLLEAELQGEKTVYGKHFYEEFKGSWEAYCKEPKINYVWLQPGSMDALEVALFEKAAQFTIKVSSQWKEIFDLFTLQCDTEQGHQYSLALFCGQMLHRHKADILRLLLNPQELSRLHPKLREQQEQESFIRKILSYLTDEIQLAQIRRALVFVAQMKQFDDPREREACLYHLVMTLSDSLDQESYRYPNWLLFQFEHDVIIRDNQKALLLAMLAEPDKTMYQLNMGEGKSTLILPLLCAELADTNQILRVNVLFSLLNVMEGLFRQRLSTLLKIRLYTLPFFRDTDISTEKLAILSKMLNTCRAENGILLVTPEHRMCLQLKTRELLMLHDSEPVIQRALQEMNTMPAIDLLDESDEILRHGTELNYAIGEKTLFDGHQIRWQISEFFIKTLFLDPALKKIIEIGKIEGVTDINEKQFQHGGVPYILLLNEYFYNHSIKPILLERFLEAYKGLFQRYATNGINQLSLQVPYTLLSYIKGEYPHDAEKAILDFLEDKPDLRITLLVTKGLLSHGILFHIFNAPYRVKYGLDFIVGKKPIALPFIGKDIPSKRSEFSHPDIILGFSILSYLYQGLSQEQLKIALLELNRLFSQTVVNQHLQSWFNSSRAWIEKQMGAFPEKLTHFENLDLQNSSCLDQLHQCLHGNIDVILFYVNNCIFPNYAYQYRHKISANAHSIVGYNAALGFSGTDDRKITMPHGVKALRTDSQQATDGKLLSVMTKSDNRHYVSVESNSTIELLQQFCEHVDRHPHCHILIDAGALVMGMNNYQVADFLIERLPKKFKGIIYFSDQDNSLTVLMRNGLSISLAQCQLEKNSLFAYLDDIHTRGTDLKLPLNSQGILTVNVGMEKDKLMQAAMRLRNLAQQQSVILWGLSKVTAAIARDNQIDPGKIDSLEVIKWVTANTIRHIAHDIYFVALRKINFYIINFAEKFLQDAPLKLTALINRCQEEELFSLREFYGLSPQNEDLGQALYQFAERQIKELWIALEDELASKDFRGDSYAQTILGLSQKEKLQNQLQLICQETVKYLGATRLEHALDTNEEKEVQVEVVKEESLTVSMREANPCEENKWDFSIITRPDFIIRANKGKLIQPLRDIANYLKSFSESKNIIWHPDIYMTRNFIETVSSSDGLDNYLRLVDVVLVHRAALGVRCVLLSAYEASELIREELYSSRNILVHLKDINGPTMLPIGSHVDREVQQLLTIVKLFNGECHYESPEEVKCVSKNLGRIYPEYFVNMEAGINEQSSSEIYGTLIEKGYLNASGAMNPKLLDILTDRGADHGILDLGLSHQCHQAAVFKMLLALSNTLIIEKQPSISQNQFAFWKWIGVRQSVKEFPGSVLESVINPERTIKF